MQSRNITVISYLLLMVGFLMLLSIWLVWAKLLRPNLIKLEKTINSERCQASAKALAQQQLAERERELRIVLDNTPGMIASIDNNYRYISANKAYLERFKLGSEKLLLGKHVKEVLGEKQWQVIHPYMEKTLKGQQAFFDIEIPFQTGSRHVQVTYVPEKKRDGNIQRFYTLIVDVHERYLAEQALRSNEEVLKNTLGSISEGVIATDNFGIITLMNPVAEKLTGFKSEDAIKQPLDTVLNVINRETKERIIYPTVRLWKQKKILAITDETVLISKDGSKHLISDSIAPIIGSSERNVGMVLTIRDITEEDRIRSELNQNMRLQSLGRRAGGISHDFNNLLSAISGAAEMILVDLDCSLTEKDRNFIQIIIRTAQNASHLTRQLMSFSQKSNQTFFILNLVSEIEDVRDILVSTIIKTIEVVLKDEARNHKVQGNSSALQNVILNMCLNAAYAMPNGGLLSIFTSNQYLTESQCIESNFDLKPGEYINMRISDTGGGIKTEIMDQIFDPFFSTKPMALGSGIGLASVYGTVIEHGGSITVKSTLGVGSEFSVLLPCTDKEIETKNEQSLTSFYPHENLGTVLLIDDDDNVREVVEAMLEQLGGKVISANNGLEGIALYTKHQRIIDLVIIDMNMPQMSGTQAIDKLQQINPECNFIAITGFSESHLFSQLDEQGIQIILRKPFSFTQLAEAVAKSRVGTS